MRDAANRRRWAGRLLRPVLLALLAGGPAAGSAQDAALTPQLVIARAAQVYAARLDQHVLDGDARFAARVNAVPGQRASAAQQARLSIAAAALAGRARTGLHLAKKLCASAD